MRRIFYRRHRTASEFTLGFVAERLPTTYDMGDCELFFCQGKDCGLAVHSGSPQTMTRYMMQGYMDVEF